MKIKYTHDIVDNRPLISPFEIPRALNGVYEVLKNGKGMPDFFILKGTDLLLKFWSNEDEVEVFNPEAPDVKSSWMFRKTDRKFSLQLDF